MSHRTARSKQALALMNTILATLLLLTARTALAQEGWRDSKGNAASETASRRTVDGFGGWLLVTSDSDWKQKWETSPNTLPNFSEVKKAPLGKQLLILTFFANPQLTPEGEAEVSCDFDVIRPNGTLSLHQQGATCFQGALKEPQLIFLSSPVIGWVGDPGDPLGVWQVRVTLHDNVRHVDVPLATSFELLAK